MPKYFLKCLKKREKKNTAFILIIIRLFKKYFHSILHDPSNCVCVRVFWWIPPAELTCRNYYFLYNVSPNNNYLSTITFWANLFVCRQWPYGSHCTEPMTNMVQQGRSMSVYLGLLINIYHTDGAKKKKKKKNQIPKLIKYLFKWWFWDPWRL